jgi:hypothetical protein
MTTDMMSTHTTSSTLADDGGYAELAASTAEREIVAESSTVQGIVGAAMVGLLGGGPRLAIRAARVVLEDSYGSRSPARQRQSRLGVRQRTRGD